MFVVVSVFINNYRKAYNLCESTTATTTTTTTTAAAAASTAAISLSIDVTALTY